MEALVVIAGTTWEGPNRRAVVELSRALGRQVPVLYVEPLHRIGARSSCTVPARGVTVLRPVGGLPEGRLPAGGLHRRVNRANRRTFWRQVQAQLDCMGFSEVCLINGWNPQMGPADLVHNPLATAYYGYDDIRVAPWKRRHGPVAERHLLGTVGLAIGTSPALVERFSRAAKHTMLLPHGVDVTPFLDAVPVPSLTGLRGPVLGFLGTWDHRVDVSWLSALAQARPDCELVLVGPEGALAPCADPLTALPNVRRLPGVRPEEVPGVLKAFDVGLLPYTTSTFNRSVFPLKTFEYLACGLPIVATDFAPLPGVESHVVISRSVDDVAAVIELALRRTAGQRAAAVRCARDATWDARADRLLGALRLVRKAA